MLSTLKVHRCRKYSLMISFATKTVNNKKKTEQKPEGQNTHLCTIYRQSANVSIHVTGLQFIHLKDVPVLYKLLLQKHSNVLLLMLKCCPVLLKLLLHANLFSNSHRSQASAVSPGLLSWSYTMFFFSE